MPKHAPRLAVERLDARCLPSAGLSAGLSNGVLSIAGTSGADRIVLNTVSLGRPARAFVVVQGVGRYPLAQVHSIQIDSGAGNDFISVNVRRAGLTTTIRTGPGNSTIYGTPGRDVITTGPGNSRIYGRGGNDQITTGLGRSIVNGRVIVVPASAQPVAPPPTSKPTPPPTTSSPPTTYTVLPQPVPTIDVAAWVSSIATLTNQERVNAGLNTLTINPKLTAIAQIAVNQMAQTGVVSHDMNGTAHPTMQNRADAVGYTFHWLGENLAFNLPDPARVAQAFMYSPSHRENMLFTAFTEVGIAVVANPYGQVYVAIEFGQPT